MEIIFEIFLTVGDFVTTCNNDFGPRTVPPGEAALMKVQ